MYHWRQHNVLLIMFDLSAVKNRKKYIQKD